MTWGEVAFVAVATLGIMLGSGIACMLIEWQNEHRRR
jgi:hypothetical protein